MAKEDAKQAYALVSLYIALYKNRYNKQPVVNRYREKWAMQDVIDSVGFDRTKELLIYYFRTNKSGHPLNFFFYNFDRIDSLKNEIDKDIENRKLLREATKKMVEGEE